MVAKKHHKAIAEIIKGRFIDLADNACGIAVRSNVEIIATDLANYFADDNPHFDRQKFLNACNRA